MLEEIAAAPARARAGAGRRPRPACRPTRPPMRARGWDAITLLAQGETIPNYHWPTRHIREHRAAHGADAHSRPGASCCARSTLRSTAASAPGSARLRSAAHVQGCGASFTAPPRRDRRLRRRVPTSDPPVTHAVVLRPSPRPPRRMLGGGPAVRARRRRPSRTGTPACGGSRPRASERRRGARAR